MARLRKVLGGKMNLITLEKRVRTLETTLTRQRLDNWLGCRSVQPLNSGAAPWVRELEELSQEARTMTDQAKNAGDLRTALASIRVRCFILELAAKLRGDLDERNPTNIVNVTLDSDAAQRIAETYLKRHKPPEGSDDDYKGRVETRSVGLGLLRHRAESQI